MKFILSTSRIFKNEIGFAVLWPSLLAFYIRTMMDLFTPVIQAESKTSPPHKDIQNNPSDNTMLALVWLHHTLKSQKIHPPSRHP